MNNSNENQHVEAEANENLFALQEELDTLYAQLGEYEGNYLNRAEARIAEIERILYRAAQPHNASENQNADPVVEDEDPSGNVNVNNNTNNKKGGRRRKTRKTRKTRKASKKTRRTRHKKYTKRR